MIKAVIFDLDDTLISEDAYIRSGYTHVSRIIERKYGVDSKSAKSELYELYLQTSKNVFDRFLDGHGISYGTEDILWLVKEYRNHVPNIKFYDDVIPMLGELRSRDIKAGIISDGYLTTQKNKAAILDLYALFDKVIFTEELGRRYWKPHPKAFEVMKKSLGVGFDEMVYIGDNPKKDFYISVIYPVVTVRILRDKGIYENAEYYEGVREKIVVDCLLDIFNSIEM